jgi:hypothetical protein
VTSLAGAVKMQGFAVDDAEAKACCLNASVLASAGI